MRIGIPLVLVGVLMIALVAPIEIARVLLTGVYTYPPWIGTVEYALFFGGMFFFALGTAVTIFEVIVSAVERYHEHRAKITSVKAQHKDPAEW